MLDAIYYYDACINSRKVLYKTHRADLEYGDKIIHTYATGACPVHAGLTACVLKMIG